MLYGFFGRVSQSATLRSALDVSAERTRGIASRVAQASLGGADGFALPGMPPQAAQEQSAVNAEQEMVNLADEQLHYETTAKLLEKTYQQIRSSIHEK